MQRLYRIGTTGEWLNYNDQPIKVSKGQVIYAKGIDQGGVETKIVSLTANVSDALGLTAYDGNLSTWENPYNVNNYMKINSDMIGKNIIVTLSRDAIVTFVKGDKTTNLNAITVSGTYIVPQDAAWIKVYSSSSGSSGYGRLYEIQTQN